MTTALLVGLLTGIASILIWTALAIRIFRVVMHKKERRERRLALVAMPIVGILASIGTVASAVGAASNIGVLSFQVDPRVLVLFASMGRGALMMGGLIAFFAYHPRE